MKNLLIVLTVLAFHCSGFAEEANEKVPVADGFKPVQFEGMPTQPTQKSASKVTFSTSCTDIAGHSFKQGDNGYEACLSQAQARAMNSGSNNNKAGAPTPGGQMNINFNGGN